jgi:hypothetical protein
LVFGDEVCVLASEPHEQLRTVDLEMSVTFGTHPDTERCIFHNFLDARCSGDFRVHLHSSGQCCMERIVGHNTNRKRTPANSSWQELA